MQNSVAFAACEHVVLSSRMQRSRLGEEQPVSTCGLAGARNIFSTIIFELHNVHNEVSVHWWHQV